MLRLYYVIIGQDDDMNIDDYHNISYLLREHENRVSEWLDLGNKQQSPTCPVV